MGMVCLLLRADDVELQPKCQELVHGQRLQM